ncbi:hypothetical protein [Corynebacterium cystitidis]|nr:hypothetical protein [Corynebacterium cystitidis]
MNKNNAPYNAPHIPLPAINDLRQKHAPILEAAASMIRHPRSLARPVPSWRPPIVKLPRHHGTPKLTLAISRHRVGPRAAARIQGYGETRRPAYLVSVRVTDPTGANVDHTAAEAWIRALLPDNVDGKVHEVDAHKAVTYVWIVDGTFTLLESPASLFEGMAAA